MARRQARAQRQALGPRATMAPALPVDSPVYYWLEGLQAMEPLQRPEMGGLETTAQGKRPTDQAVQARRRPAQPACPALQERAGRAPQGPAVRTLQEPAEQLHPALGEHPEPLQDLEPVPRARRACTQTTRAADIPCARARRWSSRRLVLWLRLWFEHECPLHEGLGDTRAQGERAKRIDLGTETESSRPLGACTDGCIDRNGWTATGGTLFILRDVCMCEDLAFTEQRRQICTSICFPFAVVLHH